ncbi:MAG TPA: hypothetical protein GXX75_10735 [Clostridiales bacterium]|nr:hypothetical protein [Clostridiales bacterium]
MENEIEKLKGTHSEIIQEVAFEFPENVRYNPKCLCGNTGCARHSNCRVCMEFHKLTDHPPTCKYEWKWKKQ